MVVMWELFQNFVGTFSIPMVSMVLCGNYNSLKLAVEMVGSLNKFDWINFSNSKIFKMVKQVSGWCFRILVVGGLDGGCLEVVWRVSGRCLDGAFD